MNIDLLLGPPLFQQVLPRTTPFSERPGGDDSQDVTPRSSSPLMEQDSQGHRPSSPLLDPSQLLDQRTAKRPREDLADFVTDISRRVKLKPDHIKHLNQFAMQMTPGQQSVALMAQMLQVTEEVAKFTAPEVKWDIPAALETRLERATTKLISHPELMFYLSKSHPVNLVMEHLEKHPSWGLTPAVKKDDAKYGLITARVRAVATHRRNELKVKILQASLGIVKDGGIREGSLNIIETTESLVALWSKADIKVTLPLVVRIAFLRSVCAAKVADGTIKTSFWVDVDAALLALRTDFSSQDALSTELGRYLKEDRIAYGDFRDHLRQLTPTVGDPFADEDSEN